MNQRTFVQRMGFHWPCVGLADALLSDERFTNEDGSLLPSLREEASRNGLCYLRIVRSLHDGTYLAQVAASMELLTRQPLTLVVTEKQLYAVLPYDCRTKSEKPAACVRSMLRAHACAVQPVVPHTHEQGPIYPAPVVSLTPLPEPIEVTAEEVSEMVHQIAQASSGEPQTTSASHWQQAFLCAALGVLMQRLYQARNAARTLREVVTTFLLKATCGLLGRLQRWQRVTRQRVVSAVPVFDEQQHRVRWRLVVGVPVDWLTVAV